MPQPTELCSALEAKLELAEKALSYSNQNLQLTMQMWIQGSPQDQRLIAERAENCSEIALLVQKIQNEIQSEDESGCWMPQPRTPSSSPMTESFFTRQLPARTTSKRRT